jgi:hypothetical protein
VVLDSLVVDEVVDEHPAMTRAAHAMAIGMASKRRRRWLGLMPRS